MKDRGGMKKKWTKAQIARIETGRQAEQMERELNGIRRALRRPLEAEFAKGELTVPQTSVMQIVVGNHGINLKDLSRAASLAHSTISGIVDRLEKRGLVERRPDTNDGRFVGVYPTAAVKNFLREQVPALSRKPLVAALERATAAERTSISVALRRLRELLGEE
jgi:DNA-binding MarR family transcriptional regulator